MNELKRLNTHAKVLRTQKSNLENQIMMYLQQINQSAIKYGNITVSTKQRKQYDRKSNKQKITDAATTLNTMGVQNAEQAIQSLLRVMKGDEHIVEKLEVKQK